jgi:restriction endonuclease Mrr
MMVLVLSHAFGLPLLFWTIPLLCVLSSAGFLGMRLFRPDDATLTLEMDGWEQELGSLELQKGQTEADVSQAKGQKGQFNECYLKYQGVLKDFQSRINRLRSTDWRALQAIPFESFLAEVFLEWGYEVETTKVSGDQGVDLIISKDGIRTAIQAKGYLSSTVGNDAVQQAHTGKAIYRCHRCAVITNSTFTASARQTAAAVGCLLIDGESIPLLIEGQLQI